MSFRRSKFGAVGAAVALAAVALATSPAQAAAGTASVHYYSTAAGDLKAKGSTYKSADGSIRLICAESLSSGYATVHYFARTADGDVLEGRVTDYAGNGKTCDDEWGAHASSESWLVNYKIAYFTAAGNFYGQTDYFGEIW